MSHIYLQSGNKRLSIGTKGINPSHKGKILLQVRTVQPHVTNISSSRYITPSELHKKLRLSSNTIIHGGVRYKATDSQMKRLLRMAKVKPISKRTSKKRTSKRKSSPKKRRSSKKKRTSKKRRSSTKRRRPASPKRRRKTSSNRRR